jgi:hypothetical protein
MSDTARIHTKLTADGSELTRALNQGVAKATDFKGQMLKIGAAIGGVFAVQSIAGNAVQFAKAFTELADDIMDVAGSLNITTDKLQTFDAVSRRSLAGVDGFRAGMKKLSEVQADAANGNATAQKSFDKLGLGAAGYKENLDIVVKALADYYARTGDMATVQDLFGKQAVKSREALMEIAKVALPELTKAMQEAGLVIGKEGLAIAARFDQMWNELIFKGKKFGVDLVDDFYYTMEAFRLGMKFYFDDKYEGRLIDSQRTKTPAQLISPEERQKRQAERERIAALDKELADSLAAYEEERNNVAFAAELRRVEEIKRNKIKSIEDAWRRDNELAQQAAKDMAEKSFNWQIRMVEMDREDSTPGADESSRNYSELRRVGLAANDIGASRQVKSQEAKMIAIEERQLVALKELKGAVEKIVTGKF